MRDGERPDPNPGARDLTPIREGQVFDWVWRESRLIPFALRSGFPLTKVES